MKVLRHSLSRVNEARRGAALLLAFLVLIVIIAIVYQINTVTLTDEKITYNEITRAKMDQAIESVFLQVFEDLKDDARAAEGGEGGADPTAGGTDPAAAPSAEEAGEPPRNPDTVDSQMDGWYTPQSTNFGDIQVRIFIRDENSKYNVLNMLQEDEEAAEEAFRRVARILDNARGGTEHDIDSGEAEDMARAMRDYMLQTAITELPRPIQLTDDEELDRVIPTTLTEFRALEGFDQRLFEDFFGEDDQRIHSISSFLTVFTSPATGPEEPGQGAPVGEGGGTVNVNTAPHAVLTGLFDSRDIDTRVWDEIRDYRNEEEEPLESEEDEEGLDTEEEQPMLDEYGQEVLPKQIYDSLDELEEVFAFESLNETQKGSVRDVLQVTSDVFEIVLAARISTASDAEERLEFESRREQEEYFRSGENLVRVVRCVVWRRSGDEDIEIVPLVRWEVLDNAPLQVLDFPEDDR